MISLTPLIIKNKLWIIIGLFLSFPAFAFAQNAPAALPPETTQTVLGEVSNFGELISLVWNFGSQVILALATFFIILGAVFYVGSAGNDTRIDQGKQMVFGSFIAIGMVILSGVLIRTLHKPAEGSTGYLTDIPNVINNASDLLISIIAGFTVLMLVYSGILTITGKGDSEKINKASRSFRYAIYGLFIGVLAYTLANTLIRFLL